MYRGGLADNITGPVLLRFSGLDTKLQTTLNVCVFFFLKSDIAERGSVFPSLFRCPDAHVDSGRWEIINIPTHYETSFI